ncbi:MAG: hypothetical protein KGJ34_02500 [Patescibacteria group bacterium]|nr:hypothetical protein [Patescibacteria group bacterium]
MNNSLATFQSDVMFLGSFLVAIVVIYFLWQLVSYIFFKGDDAHRAHAKEGVLNATITLFFILILWWICELIAAGFYH